jgi:hypothetical protein
VADSLGARRKNERAAGDGSRPRRSPDAATATTLIDAARFHNDDQLRRIEFARRWVGDRLRTCKFQKILDPKAGPLVAIREFIISRKSMGGLQTDLSSRVLDRAGGPIAGLYAAGESAGFGGGGMNGKRGLEGTFLGGPAGWRIAGGSPERSPRPRGERRRVKRSGSPSAWQALTLKANMILSTPHDA